MPHSACSRCGFQNAEGANFCRHCGQETTVAASAAPRHAATIAPDYANESPAYKAGNFRAKAISQMLVVLCGLFLFTELMTALISRTSSRVNTTTGRGNRPSPATKSGKPGPGVTGVTSSEWLTQAKDYLVAAGSQPNADWANYNLGLIPDTAPEYKEAQMLLAEILSGRIKPPSDFEIENAEAVESARGVDESITYSKLKKNPDQHPEATWAFNGKVLEIHYQGKYAEAKIGVGPKASDVIYIDGYFSLEPVVNDRVYVIGTVSGNKTYQTGAGATLTAPHVRVIAVLEPNEVAQLKAAVKRLDENERIVGMVEQKASGKNKND